MKPTNEEILEFMEKSDLTTWDEHYVKEWYGRFASPRKVWSYSDKRRRGWLIKLFPEKFDGLDLDCNLNDEEWLIPKYDGW